MPIRNPFKVRLLKQAFEATLQMFVSRHQNLFSATGEPHRLNGVASPFWQGYFGDASQVIPQGTISHAVYRAGQACRREFDVQFAHDGKTTPTGGGR